MNIIDVTKDNLQEEHICCAISDKKGETCVSSKKAWLQARFAEGLVFKKLDERGKVFIEYIPVENAWAPVKAPGYMYINCFWVSGKFKGQGFGKALLQECIEDAKAKGKKGLVVLSSEKKMPFLSDPQFLKLQGFTTADTAPPYFELLYLPFEKDAPVPAFQETVKQAKTNEAERFVLYYTNQCPHTDKYAPLLATVAKEKGVPFKLIKIETKEQAQSAPTPFTTYSLFENGQFLTNEILSVAKFEKLLLE